MAIYFKPVLSKLLFLGIFLLAVQLKNTAVEAAGGTVGASGGGTEVKGEGSTGDAPKGPPKVPCADSRQKFCTDTIKCGATECSQQGTNGKATDTPFCKCTMSVTLPTDCKAASEDDKVSAEDTASAAADVEFLTPTVCAKKCADVTAKNKGKTTTDITYSAFFCGSSGTSANCVCMPGAGEQNPDDMENVAMGVIQGIVQMISDYVKGLVKAAFSLFDGMKNMDLPGMMTGMMDGMKEVMDAMKDGDKDGGKDSEK